jgi:hypothetical protein
VPRRLQQEFAGELYELVAEPHRRAFAALAGVASIADAQTFGERIHVRTATGDGGPVERAIKQAFGEAGVGLVSFRRIVPSLEDVFIDRVRGAGS